MTLNISGRNNIYKDFSMSGQTVAPLSSLPAGQTAPPPVAAVRVSDVEGDKKGNGKKIFGIIGISVGSVALLTLIGLFTLSKGFSSGFSQKLNKLSKSLQKKIYDLSSSTKELTASQKMKLKVSQTLKPMADTMQAASNISAIKDSWIRHWLKKLKLEPVIKKMNNVFRNIVIKNTKNYYSKAESANLKFCSYLDDLIKQADDPQIKSQLKDYAQKLKDSFQNNFTTAAHYERADKAYKKMYGLDEKVYNKLFGGDGLLKNLKNAKSYVTTDYVAYDKKSLAKYLYGQKAKFSNNVNDSYNSIKQLINEIKIHVDPQDTKAVDIVKKLSEALEKYKNAAGAQEAELRKAAVQELRTEMKNLSRIFRENDQYADIVKNSHEKMTEFYKAIDVQSTKKGLAQDAITFIKEKYGKNSSQYKEAKRITNEINNNLNNAINSELNSFDKLAELQVGSLPTDILGILGPTALGTLLVVNSKDKNERISKTLTQGVPIIGGVGVTYYGTTRGWTGARNLMLGAVTSVLLNIIGTKADELYKKYAEKQSILQTAYDAWNKLQGKDTTVIASADQK